MPLTQTARPRRSTRWTSWGILVAIVLLGALFSTLNLFDWDGTTGQHPDERFMTDVAAQLKMPTSLGEYLDSSRNPLNPRNSGHTFYVYGLLPQTLTHITAAVLTPDAALPPVVRAPSSIDFDSAPLVPNPDLRVPKLWALQQLLNANGDDLTSYFFVFRVGRSWSVLFALLSIGMVFLIGRRLYGAPTGLLAALFLALAALPIQIAHFFTVDSATACFTLLSIYYAVRCAQNGGWGSFTALGLSIGAAMACRVTMATLGLMAILAVVARVWSTPDKSIDDPASGAGRGATADPLSWGAGFGLLVLAGTLALLTFRLLQPDAFIGTSFVDLRPDPRFIANLREVGAMVTGEIDLPPSQQWTGRTPFLFALQNMIVWGMGLPLGLAAWLGWLVAGAQMGHAAWLGWNGAGRQPLRRRLVHLLPWAWIGFYFAWQGGIFVMSMRYYLQLYGLLALFAAWGLIALARRRHVADHAFWAYARRRWAHLAGRAALAVVVIGTLGWGYAFSRIYTQPHARIAASRWIYEHIPAGSVLTSEQWDDALPLSIDGRQAFKDPRFPDGGGFYYNIQLLPYAEDDQSKYTGSLDQRGKPVPGLFDQLDRVDYIILSSNRVYGSAPRLPMRYPALIRYYHFLFSGELGFEQVADISAYPTLFGIPIPDQGAEEAFSVYDHPRVLIFKKTAAYARANAERLIAADVAWDEVYKLSSVRANRVSTALRLTDALWPAYRSGGTWAALFNPASLPNQAPWLVWLLALELLGLAAFPLLFRLLPSLPDRGFALAKTLGLLAVAYGAWLLGSFNVLAFTPASVWLGAGVLALAGLIVGWRWRAELRAFVWQRRAALAAAEGLFLLAFLGFTLIRALNPDLWHPARGGEKPMDLAFLTAVLKSAAFPPYDPWFAGGYINYYYFGFVIVGALVHMTGIVPTTAYNLAVPTLFALTALGAWGAAYNLIAPSVVKMTRWQDDPMTPQRAITLPAWLKRERRAIAAGVVAAAFVTLLGPLTQALWYLPGSAPAAAPDQPAACRLSSYAAQQLCRGREEWAFWDATRLVGMSNSERTGSHDSTINEFPFFTFLFADLHAHMIALPLTLAALGLMVAIVKTSGTRQHATFFFVSARALWPVLGLLALVVGALRATNTWDYPTYLGLSLLTLGLLAWRRVRDGASVPRTTLFWVIASALVVLLSVVLFLPFTRAFATDYAGFTLWQGDRTSAADFLKINGLWLFLAVSGALLVSYRRGSSRLRVAMMGAGVLALALGAVLVQASALALLLPLAGAAIGMIVDLLIGQERQPRIAPARVSVAAATSRQRDDRPADGEDARVNPYVQLPLPLMDMYLPNDPLYHTADRLHAADARPRTSLATLLPMVWATAALLIVLATEILVAKGDIGRMNTVFKFGMQSWVLFGLAAAVALAAMWPATRSRTLRDQTVGGRKSGDYAGWVWRGMAALLIGAALVYPLTATPARLADRIDARIGMTLDGIAFMRSDKASWSENQQPFTFAQDAAALEWMRANIAGSPIVLEAHTEAYRWGGRVSIYTGLPTLLGWPWHETQQRSVAGVGPVLASRTTLIQRLYTGTDAPETLRLLRLYGVEYVYFGQLERALYTSNGQQLLDALVSAGQIKRVYSDADTCAEGHTCIYQVPRGEGDPAPAVLTTTLPVRAPALPRARTTRLEAPVYTLPSAGVYAWNTLAQSQVVAVLLWLLACYALLVLGLPVTLLVFGRPRRAAGAGGYAWARLVGLLLVGYAVWMPVSMRLWHYNGWGLLWGVLLVLALNAAIVVRLGRTMQVEGQRTTDDGATSDETSPVHRFGHGLRAIGAHLLARRRAVLAVELLFLGGFALMVALRMFNPDLWQPVWGGEKPFEFGFLNAILRSPVMPPYDPFFSDGTMNYYYYGYFLVSLPVKATGIPPSVAFNLIVPTLFAITLVGACSVVARLAGRLRYGLIGAAFVALIGNLAAAFPIGLSRGLGPVREALQGGDLAAFGARLGDWFWGPSRVIYTTDHITINEFPFWSYLFADLHPHLIAMPLALLVIALAYEIFDQGQKPNDQRPTIVLAPWSLVLAALALGALAVTNPWDLPTYALLIGGALIGRAWLDRARAGRAWWGGLAGALALAGGVCLGALLLYVPFFQNYVRPAGVRGIGRVHDGSPLGAYLLIYGLFLAILAPWLLGVAVRVGGGYLRRWRRRQIARDAEPAESTVALGIVARPPSAAGAWRISRQAAWSALGVLALLLVIGLVAAPQLGAALWSNSLLLALLLLALLLAGAITLSARRLPRAAWFVAWMAAVAWAVSLGVELVYIRDHLDGGEAYRMNTVFKFGLQSWMLLALAAAAALPWLARGLRRAGPVAQGLGWACLAVLLALSLVFPLAGVPSRLAFRFPVQPGPTLDGLAFMDSAAFDIDPRNMGLADGPPIHIDLRGDYAAIRWLNTHIEGTPIVLQSDLWFYVTYGTRVAANTGLPTIVSPLHASEQHNPAEVSTRDLDVQRIYRTTDPAEALRLLAKYHVGYIYIGPIERAAYGAANMAKFEQLNGSYLSRVYGQGQNTAVTIYKVNEGSYAFPIEAVPSAPPFPPDLEQPDEQPLAAQPPVDQATIEALERHVQANPQDSGAAFELAQRYRAMKRYDEAAAVLAPPAAARPQDVALHHLWGDILRDGGHVDQAEAAYRKAIAADPSASNYNKLGAEQLKWGDLDQAAATLAQAIAIDPSAAEPHYRLGQVYEQQAQLDQAAAQYRAYLSIGGTDAPYYDEVAQALQRLGR